MDEKIKYVYKLNVSEKELLRLKEYEKGLKFNPVEDADGNLIISEEEVQRCKKAEFNWLKGLEKIPFNPKEWDIYGNEIKKKRIKPI